MVKKPKSHKKSKRRKKRKKELKKICRFLRKQTLFLRSFIAGINFERKFPMSEVIQTETSTTSDCHEAVGLIAQQNSRLTEELEIVKKEMRDDDKDMKALFQSVENLTNGFNAVSEGLNNLSQRIGANKQAEAVKLAQQQTSIQATLELLKKNQQRIDGLVKSRRERQHPLSEENGASAKTIIPPK